MRAFNLALWFALGISMVALLVDSAEAATVEVRWTNPTQYEDGSVLLPAEIGMTEIAWGTCGGTAPAFIVATVAGTQETQGAATSLTTPDLAPGTYCFRGRTFAGRSLHNCTTTCWSRFSVAVQGIVTEPIARPRAPVLEPLVIQIIINP